MKTPKLLKKQLLKEEWQKKAENLLFALVKSHVEGEGGIIRYLK